MKRDRGFTLIEALVSILILSVVMIVALTLLVSMRSFAAKQQTFTAPRQSARAAVDYLSFFLAGASDLNVDQGNPNALVVWTTFGTNVSAPATLRQSTFNNLTAAQATAGFGDEGTDIISLSITANPIRIPILVWTGDLPAGNTALLNFSAGCGPAVNDDAANLALFKQVTGATLVGATEVSGLLTVQDSLGRWRYLRITSYVGSNCAAMTGTTPTREVISIQFTRGDADQVNPPGGWRSDLVLAQPLTLNAGVEYTSFRVRNRNLEQKTTGFDGTGIYSPGFFNPDCDGSTVGAGCPAIGFTPVVENVEDLQIAYVFRNGTIWNTAAQVLSTTAPDGAASNVPEQAMADIVAPAALDVRNVRALRVSTIARSNPLDIGARGLSGFETGTYRRAGLEDRAQGPLDTVANGVFDRYRLTTTLALRNRVLGF